MKSENIILKNQNIICISSIDWDFIWQQHQAIMSTFAKNGNRVLFIENTGVRAPRITDASRLRKRTVNWLRSTKGFREELDNLYVYSPLILPFPYLRFARWVNKRLLLRPLRRWMATVGFHDPIIWTFLPTPIVLDLAQELPHKALVYYCTDNFQATSKAARKVVKYEKKVLQKSDAVFVMAKNMYEYCLSNNNNTTCIPMGIDIEAFLKSDSSNIKPKEIEGIRNPIIGYVGGIRHSIDQSLIRHLVTEFPGFVFVFVGPIQTDISALSGLGNVIFTGQKPHAELPRYIKYFDVCIIPYKKDDYTNSISAAKLNEYLIMGKPVVSTRLNEIEGFNSENDNILYIANDYQEFVRLIREAVKQDNAILKDKRIMVACANSWDKKIEQMSSIVESVIASKKNTPANWRINFIKIYKNSRRRVLSVVALFILAQLLIFYTPFMWFLAKPLKISQNPQKADIIVVFAGGVGESGKAGQGFEERVKYAVELYKKGYAGNVLFSSGYTYVFKEPLVMKVLALSLGVPDDRIFLEDNAKNTFEHVQFTKVILDKNNWQKVILVSSPYHMLRTSMVFNKIAKETEVIYAPIPNSLFYAHPQRDIKGRRIWKQITLQQIRAIFHEYLGILYYWRRGYI